MRMLTSPPGTLFVGQSMSHFSTLASTNEYAFDLLSKSTPAEGTVISTSDQYAGRGQIGSKWESEAHLNIALSVILYPRFLPVRDQFQLNIAISLAVYDYVCHHIGKGVAIKWANDIYVGDNKISGILIQNIISGSVFQSSVVGIGLNINQTEFPDHLRNPVSLSLTTGLTYDLSVELATLCQCLERRYLALKSRQSAAQRAEYLSVLYRYLESGLFQTPDGEIFYGRITGISDIGKLQIEDRTGVKYFDIKQIRFL